MPTTFRYIEAAEPDSAELCSPTFAKSYCCSLDFRGETLIYKEPERSTRMRCVLTDGYMVEAATIQDWELPDGTTRSVSQEERLEIVRRVVRYAAQVQGVLMTVRT